MNSACGCAVTLNHFWRPSVKVLQDIYEIVNFFPLDPLLLRLDQKLPVVNSFEVTFNQVLWVKVKANFYE